MEGRLRRMIGGRALAHGICALLCAVCAAWSTPLAAAGGSRLPAVIGAAVGMVDALQPVSRSGRQIYADFRSGLSDQACAADTSERWRRHFSHVPRDLAERPDRLLPLFGYVVEIGRAHV